MVMKHAVCLLRCDPEEAESNPLLFPEELIAGCLSLKERPMNMICFIHAAHDPYPTLDS